MRPSTFSATLFDYNGVLIDDEHVHLEAFREVVAPHGLTISDEAYYEKYIGFDDEGAFVAVFADAGRDVEGDTVERLIAEKFPIYMRRAETELRAFDGASAALKARAAHGTLGIVSGALRPEIELGIGHLGVGDEVAFIVAAEDTQRSKPDPEGYEIGKRELAARGADPTRALVIEDSLAGIEAAEAAGLPCVAVAHSYPRSALEASGAAAVFGTIAEVTEVALADLYRRLYG